MKTSSSGIAGFIAHDYDGPFDKGINDPRRFASLSGRFSGARKRHSLSGSGRAETLQEIAQPDFKVY